MKKVKKVISVMLAMVMTAALLCSCGSNNGSNVTPTAVPTETAATATSAPADTAATTEPTTVAEAATDSLIPAELDTITVILFGEESPRMAELMENEFQQKFIDEINTKVELLYLPWTENGIGGKVDLMIASGQEFDACIVDPSWAANSISKGYLQDLSGVIDTYLTDYYNTMDPVAFNAYKYGEAVYAIPIGNKPTAGVFNTVCVRQDILDAIGMTEIATLDDLTAYVTKAKEQYGLYATYDLASSAYIIRGTSDRNLTSLTTGLWVDQDTKQLVDFAKSDEFKSAVNLYTQWYQNDLIPKDILTNTVTLPFQANMVAFMRGTCGTTLIENEPGLKTIVADAKTSEYYINPDKAIYKGSYENTAFQVPVTSTKADRVALFVNLLQKDTEMANLFAFGVEGTDYTLEDGKISKINTDELFYEWMIYNVKISTPTTAYTDDFMEIYRNWDNDSIPSCTFGFSIDYTNIKTEKAQIDSIWTELAVPMLAGLKDYDSNIDELIAQLDAAGWEKYVTEIQSQLDAFLAK